MEDVTGKPIQTLHIVGGGSKSALLNQFSANATGRTVIAGPVEATATGNVLIQALALGHLNDLDELRQVVRNSFAVQTYKPQADWQAAYDRFQKLTA
jgi:sugar (pentulose or hexulose) kinase